MTKWTLVLGSVVTLCLLVSLVTLAVSTLNTESIVVGENETVIVSITTEDVSNLGYIGVNVSFNESVVEVINPVSYIRGPGWVLFEKGYSGLSGDIKFCELEIRAVGEAGESSYLNLDIAVDDMMMQPIEIGKVMNGTLLIVEKATISISDVEIAPGESITTPIFIKNATNITGIEVYLNCDPAIISITDVTTGNLGDCFYFKNISSGSARIMVLSSEFSGDRIIANVKLTAIGNPGETSNLSLENILVINDAGIEFSVATQNGTFTILDTPKPPCFEAVFAIAGLLAVAYLVLRRRK